MGSRHASMPGWRYLICVLAVVALPAVALHTLLLMGAGLFLVLIGIFTFEDGAVVAGGMALAALASLMLRLCWWMFRQREVVLRSHKATLGAVLMVVSLATWALAPANPIVARAVVSVAVLYGLYGIGLAINAWQDTWGL